MLKLFLVFVFIVHGLIHLLGFTKAWKLAPVAQLSGKTLFPLSEPGIKIAGIGWLLACLFFLGAAIGFLLKKDAWWMPGAAALLLSQILIVLYWHDAKAGTVANLILLPAVLLAWTDWRLNQLVIRDVHDLYAQPSGQITAVWEPEKIKALPASVQNWLSRSGALKQPAPTAVRLKQKGLMRTQPDQDWMVADAEQYYSLAAPGFIWKARVRMSPWMYFTGRDRYMAEGSNMLIQLYGLLTIVDAKGEKTAQGSMLRWLAETCWFPAAATNPCISWDSLDAGAAKATMRYGGIEATGIFYFNEQGDLLRFTADRYYDRGKEAATLEKWQIDVTETAVMNGIRMPRKTEVTWKLPTGDFTWYKLEITEIEYNRPELYGQN